MGIVLSALLGICLGLPSPAEIQRAAQKVLLDPDYQREMPGETRYKQFEPRRPPAATPARRSTPAATPSSAPPRTTPSRRTRARSPSSSGGGSGGVDLGNALLWMLVIVAGVLIAAWVGRMLTGYTKDVQAERPKAGAAPPAPLELGRTKTKAELLAERGEYAQAFHVMLLETLGQLSRRIPGGMHKSWTSREILKRVELPEGAQRALAGLVTAVESSLFGHHHPGEVDFKACTRSFEQFAQSVSAESSPRAGA